MTTATRPAWVVYCPRHGHYLTFVGATGTSWSPELSDAKRYDVRADADDAARHATWVDHNPRRQALTGGWDV